MDKMYFSPVSLFQEQISRSSVGFNSVQVMRSALDAISSTFTHAIDALPLKGRHIVQMTAGLVAAGVILYALVCLDPYLVSLYTFLSGSGVELSEMNQDAMVVFGSSKAHPLLMGLLGVYIGIIGPILEEILFRENIQSFFREVTHGWEVPEVVKKGAVILGTAVLFGLAHLSPHQNFQTNFFVVAQTFLMGTGYSLLREVTGNIVASSAAHMSHNTLVLMNFLMN